MLVVMVLPVADVLAVALAGVGVAVVEGEDFTINGVDVSGGGRGPPLRSPLILLFKAGSKTPLSFFLPLPSFPPA